VVDVPRIQAVSSSSLDDVVMILNVPVLNEVTAGGMQGLWAGETGGR